MQTLMTCSIDNFVPGQKGTVLGNYIEFRDFLKNETTGKIEGAILYDTLEKKEFKVKSKVVVNTTGIFGDEMRIKDDPKTHTLISPAMGSHIVLDVKLPENTGVLIPETTDKRILIFYDF
jgi:glycerol-3-phosphate dehydrogenase